MGAEAALPFGAVLKEYRLAAALTQEALAERAGVSARNIQNLERGQNRPLKDTARRIAEALALGERERAMLLTAVIPVPRRRRHARLAPARVDDRFRLLTGGSRDVPTRQRTLRAALDWSWELLGSQERTLLTRLAVFAGGWTLEAAEAVCADEGLERWAVLDGLDSLVGKSLVQVEETGEDAGRYRLLETVRQYAAEHLETRGEAAAARDRHLSWCLALAEEAERELKRPGQRDWLDRLEREHDNLRAALGTAGGRGSEEGLRLASALVRFWELHGHLREGHGWLTLALRSDTRSAPVTRARALQASSLLALRLGEFGPATAVLEEALALWRALGDRRGLANSLNNLGLIVKDQGDYARAMALHEEALALRRGLGDTQGIAYSLVNIAIVAARRGEYQQTIAWYEEALVLLREVGDRWAIANSIHGLGIAAYRQGDHAQAVAFLVDSLVRGREIGARDIVANGLEGLAQVATALGQPSQAGRLAGAAEALRQILGLPLPPRERPEHEQAASPSAARIAPAAFHAEWSAGKALLLDDAVAYVLDYRPALP